MGISIRFMLAVVVLGFGTGCSRKPAPPSAPAKPHSVTLTWAPPSSLPSETIIGYNVYRRSLSQSEFVKLASNVSGPPYEDRMVAGGQTYFYVVTALDKKGRESRFSDEVQAIIP
jgi:fibronectin type 3 domain-containing protein